MGPVTTLKAVKTGNFPLARISAMRKLGSSCVLNTSSGQKQIVKNRRIYPLIPPLCYIICSSQAEPNRSLLETTSNCHSVSF